MVVSQIQNFEMFKLKETKKQGKGRNWYKENERNWNALFVSLTTLQNLKGNHETD